MSMSKVLLGDVAVEHKETCKGSKDGYPIVGLEHLIPEEITLTAWNEGSENTFSKMFRKGNVLFGRRRAYLKKAAVAPFDGICSGDITVIEAKPDRILPELLPFIIQNDDLFEFAVGKSAGSLSPRVKWEHLKNYEFELPDMGKQKELAELLWAMDNTKKSYQKLIAATDELVKSQFIEMFGDPVKNPFGWPTMTLDQVTKEIVSGQCLNGDAGKLQPGQKAVLKVSAVTYGSFDANEYKVLRDTKQITKGVYPQKGDLLFSRANTREYVGATVLIDQDYPELMLPDKLWKLIFKHEIMPMFAKQFLSHPEIRKVLSSMATGTSGSMYNISMEKLKRLEIIVPNINQQKEYIHFVEQSDKSKFELEKALSELTATYKRIIAENLG
jgi:type I restriction enzyme S subunit